MPSFELLAIIALVLLAFGDLIVGVVNDASNFISSAIGAKVSSKKVILLVASVGVIIGATFSDGIIEVARKGIFSPEYFSSMEAIMIFAAVAFADIILLDLYSTFGLPTSTTVSVVFELLGAALILQFLKVGDLSQAWGVINGESAVKIIVGIVLSVGIAFTIGMIIQFVTRLIFTFEYKEKLSRFGGIWSGAALSLLFYFILVIGGKHASYMTADIKAWIAGNTWMILGAMFVLFTVISQVLIKKKVDILKIIVLLGTGALAMAFAGNDLANFIGVSVGGVNAFLGADLSSEISTPTWVLILAGVVMAAAMSFSKKAISVVNTGVKLASHDKKANDHWKMNKVTHFLSRIIIFISGLIVKPIPKSFKNWSLTRFSKNELQVEDKAFDLLRAAVNLMVAAAVISYATSMKLPLSTTYVTFMVAMGTALADGAWTKDCAPRRVAGMLTVIGGWFFTAFGAFAMAAFTVSVLYFMNVSGLFLLSALVIFMVVRLAKVHRRREGASLA